MVRSLVRAGRSHHLAILPGLYPQINHVVEYIPRRCMDIIYYRLEAVGYGSALQCRTPADSADFGPDIFVLLL